MNLVSLGWNDFFAASLAPHAARGMSAARVAVQHRGASWVLSEHGELFAEVSGRFRHHATAPSDFPVVGDWVAIESRVDEGKGSIHAVLPRRTKFSRTAAGSATEEQILAANIDDVFIVAALSAELNLRRIERCLALAWESGANPGIVLTKADLCENVSEAIAQAQTIAHGMPIFTISSVTGDGIEPLRSHWSSGRTAVVLGPSGVGKSTLINRLCGEDIQSVQPVRASDLKGRHTTTRRELICLPSGGWIIDTPGLRELQLWDGEAGIGEIFSDVESLAMSCRFTDCQHETEPGCAVIQAVENGSLDPARLESHRKLKRELAHFERRHDARAQAGQRRHWKSVTKSLRAHHQMRGRA